jgi:hypothetical protein
VFVGNITEIKKILDTTIPKAEMRAAILKTLLLYQIEHALLWFEDGADSTDNKHTSNILHTIFLLCCNSIRNYLAETKEGLLEGSQIRLAEIEDSLAKGDIDEGEYLEVCNAMKKNREAAEICLTITEKSYSSAGHYENSETGEIGLVIYYR